MEKIQFYFLITIFFSGTFPAWGFELGRAETNDGYFTPAELGDSSPPIPVEVVLLPSPKALKKIEKQVIQPKAENRKWVPENSAARATAQKKLEDFNGQRMKRGEAPVLVENCPKDSQGCSYAVPYQGKLLTCKGGIPGASIVTCESNCSMDVQGMVNCVVQDKTMKRWSSKDVESGDRAPAGAQPSPATLPGGFALPPGFGGI